MIFNKIANLIWSPFVKFWIYIYGIDKVSIEFIRSIRKVSVQNSFYKSFNRIYLRYEKSEGFVVANDDCDDIMIGSCKNRMDIFNKPLKDISIFAKFYKEVSKQADINEQWYLNYSDKKIDNIVCNVQISPDNIDRKLQNIHVISLFIIFDSSFNMISINRKHISHDYDKPILKSFTFKPVSIDETVLMIKLALASENSMLADMFPEYYEDTVYDYASIEFKQRLQLLEMVDY